ncbi:predicted protein [Histoplasma capsulatum var. duboisii H88]|uniref:Predicted protein n=2 Tax=Ajellomyces capsulatus TaxID=5037 RepID=F0UUE9_AJEC8|nr:predicted protein [Histoplasma capsulatum H143]EGC49526.1 predicted protein [Histoplasma capsulatum var. duboisii H88]
MFENLDAYLLGSVGAARACMENTNINPYPSPIDAIGPSRPFFLIAILQTYLTISCSRVCLQLVICRPREQYTNSNQQQPRSSLRGCQPRGFNWVIVPENPEGEYSGHSGRSHASKLWEMLITSGLSKIAYQLLRGPEKHIAIATKSNAQRNGLVIWNEVAAEGRSSAR